MWPEKKSVEDKIIDPKNLVNDIQTCLQQLSQLEPSHFDSKLGFFITFENRSQILNILSQSITVLWDFPDSDIHEESIIETDYKPDVKEDSETLEIKSESNETIVINPRCVHSLLTSIIFGWGLKLKLAQTLIFTLCAYFILSFFGSKSTLCNILFNPVRKSTED